MEDSLSFDNILGLDEIEGLFDDEETQENTVDSPQEEKKEENNNTTEVNPNELFEEPESVGSEEDIKEEEDTKSEKDTRPSPNKYIYSSIANALKDEGIFPDLNDEVVNGIKTPEDFRDLIDQQIKSGIDERYKRIDAALSYGIEPDEVRQYESSLAYLNKISEDDLLKEDDASENLRKQLIYQDFINRGYSKERAEREVKKSLNAGTDIEDAKESLRSNIDFFQEEYNNLIESAKKQNEALVQERKKKEEEFKKSILEDKGIFGEFEVDKKTRQKVYDVIVKPVHRDRESGAYYSELQKYKMENEYDFLKNVSLAYTLTDGFKNFGNLLKGKVKKEVKSSLRDLERTLSGSTFLSDGNLKFASGVNEDTETLMTKGWTLDV